MGKEKPIIFSTDMVRAILEGRKTQTRQAIKPQPELLPRKFLGKVDLWTWDNKREFKEHPESVLKYLMTIACPYGQAGDRLWVRETWRVMNETSPMSTGIVTIQYGADKTERQVTNSEFVYSKQGIYLPVTYTAAISRKWQSAIFMPQAIARITLEITGLRAERIQEISEANAEAEGIIRQTDGGNNIFWFEIYGDYHGNTQEITAIKSFARLWDSLNAKRGYPFDSNHWVWVRTFKRVNDV